MTTTPTGVAAIEMRGVTCGSMKDTALTVAEDVNWTVQPGESWVLAGAQRAGKTDFLMMTGGLMAPTRGAYYLNGQEMPIFDDDRLADRLKIGVVFDGGQLFNNMSVAENVALPLRYHAGLVREDGVARLEALLSATNLASVAKSRPEALGRSMQKQVGLARALALRPEVLLVDNPLSGMGPRHAAWWLRFLDELARGHEIMDGKPVTVVATADDLRAWSGGRQQFASLARGRFSVLGEWTAVERSSDAAVQELLHEPRAKSETDAEPPSQQ